jgi:hypothetical protein
VWQCVHDLQLLQCDLVYLVHHIQRWNIHTAAGTQKGRGRETQENVVNVINEERVVHEVMQMDVWMPTRNKPRTKLCCCKNPAAAKPCCCKTLLLQNPAAAESCKGVDMGVSGVHTGHSSIQEFVLTVLLLP